MRGGRVACPAEAGRDPAAPGLKAQPVGDGSVGAGVAGMQSWERGAELPASEATAPAASGRPDVRLLRGEHWGPSLGVWKSVGLGRKFGYCGAAAAGDRTDRKKLNAGILSWKLLDFFV